MSIVHDGTLMFTKFKNIVCVFDTLVNTNVFIFQSDSARACLATYTSC